jgi:hypothetical protein
MFYNGASVLMQSADSNFNGLTNNSWSVPITLSGSGTNNASPSIATSISGNTVNAAAVWLAAISGHNHVVAMTGVKNLVSPPSNLHVLQTGNNFGVFTDFTNTVSWQASPDPSVVGYEIFRNGILIGGVDANTLQFQDHNQIQHGALMYSVTAINNDQSQSRSVTVNFP